jgi:hypothetical protein
MIDQARAIDPEAFDYMERKDEELRIALHTFWMNGCVDDQAGDVETTNHVFRVGRHVMETDSAGFTHVWSYGTESGAQELIDFVAGLEEGE